MSTEPSPGSPPPSGGQPPTGCPSPQRGATQPLLVLGGVVVAAIVAVIIVVVVASGGGDGDDGDDGDEIVQASPTVEADATETTADGDGNGDGGGDGDLGDLASLAGEASDVVTAKVTYKVTNTVGGETTEAEWVIVQRPPDSRIEMSSMDGGVETRTISITSGDKFYQCTSMGGEEICYTFGTEETGGAEAFDTLFGVPQALAEEDEGLFETSQRRIAGMDANCFTIADGLDGIGESEVCFSDDGILLYSRTETGDDSFLFEATSASTKVTDKDFEPPYPVTEFDIPNLDDIPDLDGFDSP